ncbi:MAG: hypothetical protein ACPGJP_03065 [Hyphomicrobiales bacterium]
MRYYINYINKGGSKPDGKVILEETKITDELSDVLAENEYNFKEEYIKNNVVPNDEGMVGIVINTSFGGFWLSDYAYEKLGIDRYDVDIDRFNPALVKLVEDENEDGKINKNSAKLVVKYIPFEYYQPAKLSMGNWKGEYFSIEEYDGLERIILDKDKMDIIKLLGKIRDVVNSGEECERKIQILEDILNIPEFTIRAIVEHSKLVTNFGEEYFKAKLRFEEER